MFACRSELPGHQTKNTLIEEEYGIPAKTATAGNPQANSIIDQIQQVLGNFIQNLNWIIIMYTILNTGSSS